MPTTDRTGVANRAAALSDMFAVACARVVVGGDVPRRPVLTLPDGMSTMGGKQARQAILLDPGAAGIALTAGWVDLPRSRAGLRTHTCLVESHRARFKGRPFSVDKAGYEHFALLARRFLMEQDFVIETESWSGVRSEAPEADRAGSGSAALLVAMLAVGVAAVTAIWFMMLR